MNTISPPEENPTKDKKFYSANSIHRATFLGGPLAAGYLIGENFKALNKPVAGRNALYLSIVVTVAIFALLFLLPDNFVDNIPKMLLPLIYLGLTALIIERTQGNALRKHKEHNNKFYSAWRAVGISLIPLLMTLGGILAFYYLNPERKIEAHYDAQLEIFSRNEKESLAFFDGLNTKTKDELLEELDHRIIPKWQENKMIIQQALQLKSLDDKIQKQNEILLEYCKLNLRNLELVRKTINEDTDLYSFEIKLVKAKIDAQLEELKNI